MVCIATSRYNGECAIELLTQDLQAIKNRDPACLNTVNAFLNFKGFKALQVNI